LFPTHKIVDAKVAAVALGFTKELWDADKETDACDNLWKDLTATQQDAAAVLGHDESSWNAD
jgi:hypothetical protein